MTKNQKLLLGAGAVVVAVLVLRRVRGNVTLGELTVTRDADGKCGCFEVDTSSGVVRTKKVSNARCAADPALATEMAQCENVEGPFGLPAELQKVGDFFKNLFTPHAAVTFERLDDGQCLCADATTLEPRPLDDCRQAFPFATLGCR